MGSVPRTPIDPTVRMAEVTDEPIHHVYYGYDRTECEVEVDGAWHFGEVRSWDRDEHGDWSAYVMWSTAPAKATSSDASRLNGCGPSCRPGPSPPGRDTNAKRPL